MLLDQEGRALSHPLADRDRRIDAVAVDGHGHLVSIRQVEALSVACGELQLLLRHQEPQRGIALRHIGRPEVTVGAQKQPLIPRLRRSSGRHVLRPQAGRGPRLALPAIAPAQPRAADLLVGQPLVERHLGADRGEDVRGRLGIDPGAECRGDRVQEAPAGDHALGQRDVAPQALQAALGMGDGALLLRECLGRDDEVGEPGRLVLEGGDGDDEGAGERPAPPVGVRVGPDRVGVDEQHRAELVRGESLLDLRAAESAADRPQAGPGRGQAANLTQSAGIRLLRDLEQAGADSLVHVERVHARV